MCNVGKPHPTWTHQCVNAPHDVYRTHWTLTHRCEKDTNMLLSAHVRHRQTILCRTKARKGDHVLSRLTYVCTPDVMQASRHDVVIPLCVGQRQQKIGNTLHWMTLMCRTRTMCVVHAICLLIIIQPKADGGWQHVKSLDKYMKAWGDVSRPRQTSEDRCVEDRDYVDKSRLTSSERCIQSMEDMCIPCLMSTDCIMQGKGE